MGQQQGFQDEGSDLLEASCLRGILMRIFLYVVEDGGLYGRE
jgi:hypothetical protein